MKNLIIALLVTSWHFSIAQETAIFSVDAKKISQTETPVSVLEAVERDFPGNEVVDYFLYNDELVNSEWSVTVEDNVKPDDKVDHYTVLIKGKKGGYAYGLYDKDGVLKSMKMVAVDFELPSSMRTIATTGKYAGYTISSDKFVKILDQRKDKEYVVVRVEKGNDQKKLFFSSDGKLIKEK